MKISCSIIRDLLPLYAEQMVSEETAALVEEHLSECPACAAELAVLQPGQVEVREAFSDQPFMEEAVPLKKVKRRLFRKNVLIALTAVLVVVALMMGIAASSGNTGKSAEDIEVLNALAGAFETQMQLGSFRSSDGTTSALSEEEINSLVSEYTAKAHKYFASSNECYEYYPWLNEYYLREAFQSKVCQCLDGGVSNLTIEDINYVNDHEAEVKGTVTHWNKWIMMENEGEEGKYSDGLYHVTLPVGTYEIDAVMVKESDGWKVKEDYHQYTELVSENLVSDPAQGYENYEDALAIADAVNGIHWQAAK